MNKKVLMPIMALLVLSMIPPVMAGGVHGGGKPVEIVRVEVDEMWPEFEWDEGGWIWYAGKGFIVIHVFREGEYLLINYHLTVTYWNNETMKALSGPSIGPAMVDFVEGTFVGIGIYFMARQPRGPPLVLDIGKIVFDLEPPYVVIESHGPHQCSEEVFFDQLGSLIEEFGSLIDG